MDGDRLKGLLQTLEGAVAVVEPVDWKIAWENARFFEWFPPDGEVDAPLPMRLPGLDTARAQSRIERGKAYQLDTETGSGARRKSVGVSIRRCSLGTGEYLVVEGHDVGKQREAEYMLDSYSKMVERNTRELQREKERVEKLLLNIMPRAVYEEMKDFGSTTPQRFDDATILMLDFVGFTNMAVSRDPSALITELNDIFTAFDRIVELFDAERMKTIGLAEPMQILVSADTYAQVRDGFSCTDQGEQDVKGFGRQRVYSLEAEVRPPR